MARFPAGAIKAAPNWFLNLKITQRVVGSNAAADVTEEHAEQHAVERSENRSRHDGKVPINH